MGNVVPSLAAMCLHKWCQVPARLQIPAGAAQHPWDRHTPGVLSAANQALSTLEFFKAGAKNRCSFNSADVLSHGLIWI